MFKSQEEIDTINNFIKNKENSYKLQENQLALMEAVADQYEEHLQNRINDLEVQASIYEAVLALGGE